MEFIKNLGLFTIGSISIAGAIVFITKFIITKVIDGIFESYKLKLSKEIEEFKINLQKQSYEHSVTFNKLYLERADAIKSLYIKLVELHDELTIYNKYVLSEGRTDDISDGLRNCLGEFLTCANYNRIYFDEKICFNLKEIESIIIIVFSFISDEYGHRKPISSKETEEFVGILIDKEIPEFQNALEKQFKKILGVSVADIVSASGQEAARDVT